MLYNYKNIKRHAADTIVSLPNPKQSYFRFDDDDKTNYGYSLIIKKEMGKLKTRSPTYCIMDIWENMLNLTHTLDRSYPRGIL